MTHSDFMGICREHLPSWRAWWCEHFVFAPRWVVVVFALVTSLRVILCVLPPLDTTDLCRHLGFTMHFFDDPKAFYWLTPSRFSDEFWSRNWRDTVYIYPPLTLIFFAIFGKLGAGFFWVKLALTLCDLLAALLVGRAICWIAAMLIYAAPASIWYTSHEGQYEGLVTLLLVVAVLSAKEGSWRKAGIAFMLSLQCKQLAIFIAPYLLLEIFLNRSGTRLRSVAKLLTGMALAALPFVPFYIWRHDLWLLPLQGQMKGFNPFFWPLLWNQDAMRAHFGEHPQIVWNTLCSTLPIVLLLLFLVSRDFWKRLPQALPTLGFYSLVKSLKWAMYWYFGLVPGFALALWRHRGVMLLLLAINWFVYKDVLNVTRYDIGHQDSADKEYFGKCIWRFPAPANHL